MDTIRMVSVGTRQTPAQSIHRYSLKRVQVEGKAVCKPRKIQIYCEALSVQDKLF
jgi:hypothetical protein